MHLASTAHEAARHRAVQWMNRGHALSGRGADMEALVAYAHAIVLLRPLPLAEQPVWANSLGAALMNHGQLLHRVYGVARAAAVLDAFAEAIACLVAIPPAIVPWARRNLAGVYVNRANLMLDLGRFRDAQSDARLALDRVEATTRDNAIDADLGLKARRVLCDAIGQTIAGADATEQDALATNAGDVVDDALALVRYWSTRDETAFAALAVRFFRFGVELYLRHQPQFLVEFIEENLAAAPGHGNEMRDIARAALDAGLADGAVPAFLTLGDPAAERALRTRQDLVAARARLESSALVT